MLNTAIFSPIKNAYSETFIQAHKNFLKGNIFYYYGGNNLKLENHNIRPSYIRRNQLRLQRKILNKTNDFIYQSMVLDSLRKHKIQVILVEYGTHAKWLLPYVKDTNIPMVVHFHGYDASSHKIIHQPGFYDDVFQYASKVIAVSRKMEETLLDLGCPPEKLIYNVYGPHPEFLDVKPHFQKKQLISIGRFTNKKAPYYTLLAFKETVAKHPDAKLIMAGDGELRSMCKNIAKYYGIGSNIEFPGVITPEQYRLYLSEAMAFVQHSITAENGDMEGTPLAVLEASAAGVPVISTFHAGIPDVIIHQETGLLCSEHDVETMAKHMDLILCNSSYAQELGSAGKKNITENFSLDRHIDQLQEILKSSSDFAYFRNGF